MEWSKHKTIQFIESYRSFAFLWDSKHEYYKNKVKRHYALLDIAAKFKIDKNEVERKIKNLQSHFLREKKRQENRRSGTGAEEAFVSKWFAYKSLLFLSSRNKPYKPVDSLTQMISNSVDDSVDSDSNGITKADECRKHSEQVSEAYSIIKEVLKNRTDKDEFSLFGEQVAMKLRKITSPYARVTLQNKINTLLMEGELGVYDSFDYDQREQETRNPQSFNTTTAYMPTPIQNLGSGDYISDCANSNFEFSVNELDVDQKKSFVNISSAIGEVVSPDCGNSNLLPDIIDDDNNEATLATLAIPEVDPKDLTDPLT